MRILRPVRWLFRAIAGLTVLLVILAVAGLGYRAWRQHTDAKALVVATPNGVDDAMFVPVGDTQQWITIRGQDRTKPIILVVHGGPGAPMHALARPLVPWERHFVLVQWDQPGAGRTFGRAGAFDRAITIESIARDGNRIAELVRDRLGQQRIILLGWSWGSAVGLHMIGARPDLYDAFVGTGQIVDMDEGEALAYEQVLTRARQRGDADAIAELEGIGAPPYDSMDDVATQRKWAATYEGYGSIPALLGAELLAPRSSLRDVGHLIAGLQQSAVHFFGPTLKGPFAGADLRTLGLHYDVPIYIVQGTEDDYTPAEPSRRFVDAITAPDKSFIPIEGAGHFAVVTHAAEFLTILNDLVARLDRARP